MSSAVGEHEKKQEVTVDVIRGRPLSTPREGCAAVFSPELGALIGFGGFSGMHTLNTVVVCKPGLTPQEHAVRGPMISARYHGTIGESGNVLIVVGGLSSASLDAGHVIRWQRSDEDGEVEFFHCTEEFVFSGEIPANRESATLTMVASGDASSGIGRRWLLFGGWSREGLVDEPRVLERVGETEFRWLALSVAGDKPSVRLGHSCVWWERGRRMVLCGGGRNVDVWMFDPATCRWRKSAATLDRPLHSHAAGIVGNYMVVHGGVDSRDEVRAEVCVLELAEEQWVEVESAAERIKIPKRYSATFGMHHRCLVLLGGYNESSAIKRDLFLLEFDGLRGMEWSTETHWQFGNAFKEEVFTVLLMWAYPRRDNDSNHDVVSDGEWWFAWNMLPWEVVQRVVEWRGTMES